MATKIRLKRIGRRNRPFYRVIVIDSRKRRDGAAIEELGWYNPIDRGDSYKLAEERVFHWLEQGAQVTDTVHNLFQRSGIAFKWHLKQQGLDEKAVEKELQKWQLKQADKAQKAVAAKPAPKPEKVEAVDVAEPAATVGLAEEETEVAVEKAEPVSEPEPETTLEPAEDEQDEVEEPQPETEETSDQSAEGDSAVDETKNESKADVDSAEEKQSTGEG